MGAVVVVAGAAAVTVSCWLADRPLVWPVSVKMCVPVAKALGMVRVKLTPPPALATKVPIVSGADCRTAVTASPGAKPLAVTVVDPPTVRLVLAMWMVVVTTGRVVVVELLVVVVEVLVVVVLGEVVVVPECGMQVESRTVSTGPRDCAGSLVGLNVMVASTFPAAPTGKITVASAPCASAGGMGFGDQRLVKLPAITPVSSKSVI